MCLQLVQTAGNTISINVPTLVYLLLGQAVTMSPMVGLVAMAVTGPSCPLSEATKDSLEGTTGCKDEHTSCEDNSSDSIVEGKLKGGS